MTQKQRMLAGQLYTAEDEELQADDVTIGDVVGNPARPQRAKS